MNRWLQIAAIILAVLFGARALAQPQLVRAVPGAVLRGSTVEVTLYGEKLAEAQAVWTTFPSRIEFLPKDKPSDTQMHCRIRVDEDTPLGMGGLVVASPAGASVALHMLVDDLMSVSEKGDNRSDDSAQAIELPVAIDGQSQRGASDFFVFSAAGEQRLVMEVVARRMGSKMDPVLWLRDEHGRELGFADDDPGYGVDCRLAFVAPHNGQYFIEVRDNDFQGARPYRLRIGSFPFVTSAYPLSARRGQTTTLDFVSTDLLDITQAKYTIPASYIGDRFWLGVRRDQDDCSALLCTSVSDLNEELESEPNGDPDQATPVPVPCAVNGRLAAAGDHDHFQFDAKKGQRFELSAQSRSLGSPTYVSMRLFNAAGRQIAQSKVGVAEEESLAFNVPADGAYTLLVKDLLGRGGPDYTYRVRIAPPPPFALSVKSGDPKKKNQPPGKYQFVAPPSGALLVDVQCKRNGYSGPITLVAQSPAGPLKVYNQVIHEKSNETRLIVVHPTDVKAGDFVPIRIVGRASIADEEVLTQVSTSSLLQQTWPHLVSTPSWCDGLISVATSAASEEFFSATSNGNAAPSKSGDYTLTVEIQRTNEAFKDPVQIIVEGLPAGFQYTVKQDGKPPQESYNVSIKGPAEISVDEHDIRVACYGEWKGRGQLTVIQPALTPLQASSE